jgi:tetratricopeptide (TPR) repeat protein
VLAAGLAGVAVVRHLQAWGHAREAQRAVERHDLAGAREHLNRCLQVWPNSAPTRFQAARTARRLGLYDEAEIHLKRCQELGGDAASIKLERYLARAQRGDLPGVEEELRAEVDRDHPDSVLILEALCQGYRQSFVRLPAVMQCLDQWLDRDPNAVQALLWRGELRCTFHDAAGGISDYRRAVEIEPDNTDTRLSLAEALFDAHALTEASEQFERVLQQQPDNPSALLGLAGCRRDLGQPDPAAQLIDTLLRLQPENAAALRERGNLALNAGQLMPAARWLRQAVQLDPEDKLANFLLAECLTRLNEQRGSGWVLTAPWVLGAHWLMRLEALAYQARFQRRADDETRLNRLLAQAMSQHSRDPDVYYEIGCLFLRFGQVNEARQWLTSALYLNPGHAAARQALQEELPRMAGMH